MLTKEDKKERRLLSAAKASQAAEKRDARKRKNNAQDITNIAVAASREGITYGQYVTKYGL